MNAGGADGYELAAAVARAAADAEQVDVVVTPATALAAVSNELSSHKGSVGVAGQNMSPHESGAFTGEVSADAPSLWRQLVILGHSERRQLFETDESVREKTEAALKNEIVPSSVWARRSTNGKPVKPSTSKRSSRQS